MFDLPYFIVHDYLIFQSYILEIVHKIERNKKILRIITVLADIAILVMQTVILNYCSIRQYLY